MAIIPKSDVPANKQAESVEDFLDFVKGNSPFYKEFWSFSPALGNTLECCPLTDHAAYWQANTCLNSSVVTSEQQDGIIFKTGGTTAKPKVSFYSHSELEGVSRALATSLVRCGVRQGDKVINLFYAGDMYGSFLLHIMSVFYLPIHERVGAVQLPVAGHVTTESMVSHILEFEGTVVLSTVTTMVKMAELLAGAGWQGRNTADSVRLLLFSGEALYNDQVGTIKRAFPSAELRSLIYGTMECGAIGLPPHAAAKERFPLADGLKDPRVHQVNRPGMMVEIINEDGTVTTEPGTPGSLVVTNLERRLMPVVRYPSGDRAEWVDFESGLFRVLGRDQTAIRLGPVSIDFTHLREAVASALGPGRHVSGVQAVVGRQDAKDLLTVLIAFKPASEAEEKELQLSVAEQLGKARPMFKGHVELGLINPLGVSFVTAQELTVNERTALSCTNKIYMIFPSNFSLHQLTLPQDIAISGCVKKTETISILLLQATDFAPWQASMADSMRMSPLVTEEDFNFAMGFTEESPLEARFKAAQEEFNRQYRHLRQADGQYYADNGPEADRVFHLFPKLPAELQLKVWKEAINNLPVPKLQKFNFDFAYDPSAAPPGRAGNGLVACFKPKHNRALAGHVSLLKACIDSRNAFLNSGIFEMVPLTYLVGPADENKPSNGKKKQAMSFEDRVKKSNAWFEKKYGANAKQTPRKRADQAIFRAKKRASVAPKAPKDSSQVNKVFVHVLFPVSFEHTRVLIDKVAVQFAYKSVHPSPPSIERAFTQAAGLEFVHRIKRLAFTMSKGSWNQNIFFSDWFATSPDQYRYKVGAKVYTLGALEELSYVSASAVRRQCCIGADTVWNSVPKMVMRQFDREFKDSMFWSIRDLYRAHLTLMRRWEQFDQGFKPAWHAVFRQKCTCRR